MSVDNTALTVDILGDASSAVSAAGVSQAAIDSINASVAKLAAAMEAETASSDAATAGISRVGEASARTSGLADALTEHSLLMSRGFEAVGVEAGTAAARVGALGDTLGRFAMVNPAILAVVAALTALFAGFEQMKAGVDEATKVQNSMEELRISVTRNGESWSVAGPKIDQWSADVARATGVARDQSLPQLQKLIDSGQSSAAAIAEMTIAAQAAEAGMGGMARGGEAASNVTRLFYQNVMALNEAESGHYTRLEMIDAQLTPIIDKYAKASDKSNELHDILVKLNADTQDAINKNDSNKQAWERLSGEMSLFREAAAEEVLPALTDIAKFLLATIDAAEKAATGMKDWAEGTATAAKAGASAVIDAARAIIHALQSVMSAEQDWLNSTQLSKNAPLGTTPVSQLPRGHNYLAQWFGNSAIMGNESALQASAGPMPSWMQNSKDLADARRQVEEAQKGADQAAKGVRETTHSFDDFWGSMERKLKEAQDRLKKDALDLSGLKDFPTPSTTKGGGTGYNAPSSTYQQDAIQRTEEETRAKNELLRVTDTLNAAKEHGENIENVLTNAVKLSTTTLEANAAQRNLDAQKVTDLSQQHQILAGAISAEQVNLSRLTNEQRGAQTQYEALNKQLDEHSHGLEGTKKESLLTKEEMTKLSAAVADAKAHYEDASHAIETITAALKQQRTELATNANSQRDAADQQAEAIAAVQRKWDDFVTKQSESDRDSTAKRELNATQLVAFYQNAYLEDVANYENALRQKDDANVALYEQRMEDDERKLNDAKQLLYQQDYQNFKQIVDKMTTLEEQFVEAVFIKHKNLRTELKSVWDEMLQDFISMLTKMEASWVESGLMKLLASIFPGVGSNVTSPFGWNILSGNGSYGGTSPADATTGAPLGPSAVGAAVSGATSYGILGALLGSEGASQVIGALANSSGVTGHPAGAAGGNMNLTVSPSSVAGAAGGSSAAAAASSGSGSAASTLGGAGGSSAGARSLSSLFTGGNAIAKALGLGGAGTSSPGSAWTGTFDNSATGGITGAGTMLPSGLKIGGVGLGSLLAGALGGELLSHMAFGNNQYSEIGGAVGGAAGTLLGSIIGKLLFTGGAAAGPMGMIIGGILGSLAGGALGSLFGNHFSQADEPDVYQTQQWGQELADMQGSTPGDPMVANGQNFTMDSWTRSNTMGLGWNRLFEQFIAKFRSNPKVLPQELQAGFQNLEELWGGATNQGDFNDNGKNGVLSIGSGRSADWTTFWGYIGAYGPAIASLMQMYEPQDLYSASLRGSVSEVGGFSPNGTPWLLHQFPDVGIAPGGSGGPGADAAPAMNFTPGASKQTVTNVNVYASFGGSMIAQTAFVKSIRDAVASVPGFSQADLSG